MEVANARGKCFIAKAGAAFTGKSISTVVGPDKSDTRGTAEESLKCFGTDVPYATSMLSVAGINNSDEVEQGSAAERSASLMAMEVRERDAVEDLQRLVNNIIEGIVWSLAGQATSSVLSVQTARHDLQTSVLMSME